MLQKMDIKITLCAMGEISPFGLIKVKKNPSTQ